MNSATTYGLLAATLLAVYKLRQSGGANVDGEVSDAVSDVLNIHQGSRP